MESTRWMGMDAMMRDGLWGIWSGEGFFRAWGWPSFGGWRLWREGALSR